MDVRASGTAPTAGARVHRYRRLRIEQTADATVCRWRGDRRMFAWLDWGFYFVGLGIAIAAILLGPLVAPEVLAGRSADDHLGPVVYFGLPGLLIGVPSAILFLRIFGSVIGACRTTVLTLTHEGIVLERRGPFGTHVLIPGPAEPIAASVQERTATITMGEAHHRTKVPIYRDRRVDIAYELPGVEMRSVEVAQGLNEEERNVLVTLLRQLRTQYLRAGRSANPRLASNFSTSRYQGHTNPGAELPSAAFDWRHCEGVTPSRLTATVRSTIV